MNSVRQEKPSLNPSRRAILALGACAMGPACSDEGNQPKRVHLEVHFNAAEGAAEPFPLPNGYTGRVTRALVALDALYFFRGAPAVTARSRSLPARVRDWFAIPSAHAHPGHYASGEAVGQMLNPAVVDVLDAASLVASGDGVTGEYRSLRVVFARVAEGPLAGELEGHSALLEGTATLGERVVEFRLRARFEELALSLNDGVLDGCVFEEHSVRSDGVVSVRIDPRVWLALADFSELAAPAEGVIEIPAGQKPHTAFIRGLAQARAYAAQFRSFQP